MKRSWCGIVAVLVLIGSAVPASAQVLVSTMNGGSLNQGRVRLYDSFGTLVNANFISAIGNAAFGSLVLSGNELLVSRRSAIDKYDPTTGALITSNFVSGLNGAWSFGISGSSLYTANQGGNSVGKYDATTGAAIDAAFVPSITRPYAVTESGGRLYVAYESLSTTAGAVAVYDSNTGAAINTSLVTGLDRPHGVLLSGGMLYVSQYNGAIGVFDPFTGSTLNSNFLTTPASTLLLDMVPSGSNLFVATGASGAVAQYDFTSGAPINTSFITVAGLEVRGLAIVPEPAALGLVALVPVLLVWRRRAACRGAGGTCGDR